MLRIEIETVRFELPKITPDPDASAGLQQLGGVYRKVVCYLAALLEEMPNTTPQDLQVRCFRPSTELFRQTMEIVPRVEPTTVDGRLCSVKVLEDLPGVGAFQEPTSDIRAILAEKLSQFFFYLIDELKALYSASRNAFIDKMTHLRKVLHAIDTCFSVSLSKTLSEYITMAQRQVGAVELV